MSTPASPPPPAFTAPPATALVIDASFVIALLRGHSGAVQLADVLPRSHLLSITLTEVITVLARPATGPNPGTQTHPAAEGVGQLDVQDLTSGLRTLGVRLVDYPCAAAAHVPTLLSLDNQARQSAKATGRAQRPLSLGDRCLLSYALHHHLPVLTGDRHWAELGLSVDVHTYQSTRSEQTT